MTAATKRKPVDILNLAPKKRRSARPDENASNKWIEHIRDQDPGHGLASLKNFERVTSFRFAAAVLSKKTVERCISLLETWRNQALPTDTFRTTSRDPVTRAAMFVRSAKILEAGAELNILLLRLAELCFASEMDSAKAGSTRVGSDRINDVLRQLEWPQTKESRKALHNRLMKGRKWLSICGNFGSGLLCLIPFTSEAPYYISKDTCQQMDEAEIKEFQDLIGPKKGFVRSLCEFGNSLQKMVLESWDMEFRCETEKIISLNAYSEDELLSILQPVPYHETSIYETGYDWSRPQSWPWDWPIDPTWTPPDYRCDLCQATQCDCISSLTKNCCRIMHYGAKGRGIQVCASSRGGIAYKKDSYIGELTGQLVPPMTYTDGMALELHRPDIADEPVVCQVYCKEKGNWVRLVNHSCSPCARFVVKVVSGKVRVMLQAIRDIWDGGEVTANYGRDFFKNNDCLCEICEAEAQPNQGTNDLITRLPPSSQGQ
ncbi:SET domain-containing protein [Zopfia rhizophila CBS 207.26]|uniref:SET domain-containing protein n=1 Tax=Zopfia rhizophila CBS 207.26 TaxID=1314779 RepID=A0A6A6EBC0_9PEZI|nr:SET domain-containing protein [Zopfia rhizophila CBS 207.26]